MAKYVYWFRELVDLSSPWAKSMNYGTLYTAGFPIPPGYVIDEQAKREIERAIDLDISKISTSSIPEALRKDIIDHYFKLNIKYDYDTLTDATKALVGFGRESNLVLVRAGSKAYPNIRGTGELLEAVLKCFSLGSGPVIIQKMVAPEKAGIMYTSKGGSMSIEATYGFASPIASKEIQPDTYTISNGQITNKVLGSKQFALITNPHSRTIEKTSISPEKQKSYVLHQREIEVVCRLAKKLEEHAGKPQKATWGIEGRKVYLLNTEDYSSASYGYDSPVETKPELPAWADPPKPSFPEPVETASLHGESNSDWGSPSPPPSEPESSFSGFAMDIFDDKKEPEPTPSFLDPAPEPSFLDTPATPSFLDTPATPSWQEKPKKGAIIKDNSPTDAESLLIKMDDLAKSSSNELAKAIYEMTASDKETIVRLSDGGTGLTSARGIRRMGSPEFNLELEALSKIASHRPRVKLALPFVTSVGEVRRAEDELARYNVSMDVGVVIETPAAVSIVDKLAELAKFVLVDIDHLAELMLATEQSSSSYNSKHEAIFNAVKGVIKICKSKNVPVYVCGTEAEHSDFDSALEGSKVIFSEEKSFKPETSVLSW